VKALTMTNTQAAAQPDAPPRALPAELTIYTVAELHPQWLKWLTAADDEACTVDASAVEQADAAGVQLLLSLHAALHRQGRALALREPSPALLSACAALGLSNWAAAVQSTLEAA
jgi:anti-anti-sigma regulatory factor